MTPGKVDYAASYVKYKRPTPIQGIPTNKVLKWLKVEIQENVTSVEIYLGGGYHEYLSLVLIDAKYRAVTMAPLVFVAPAYPTKLTIPGIESQVEVFTCKEMHKETQRPYYECKNIKKAL